MRQHAAPLVATLANEYGSGLLTRACTRLLELAESPGQIFELANAADAASEGAPRLEIGRGPDHGLGEVEAARGRLFHYLRLHAGRIAHYAILAPTEWNFHPRGTTVKALESLTLMDARALRSAAEILIKVIDPCVSYELRLLMREGADGNEPGITGLEAE